MTLPLGYWIITGFVAAVAAGPITLENGKYEGIVVTVSEDVPSENCRTLLDNLEIAVSSASRSLHVALEGRAFFSEVSVVLPDHWSDGCTDNIAQISRGESSDFIVGRSHPVHGDAAWTQQSRGCGEQGDFVYLSEKLFAEPGESGQPGELGATLVKEWAKYRYGIFDEIGYENDAVYPQCFHGINDKPQVTGCSDRAIDNICASGDLVGDYNTTRLVHPDASKSILFSTADHVTKFCDEKTHDAFAPTKQNLNCNRRSAMEVILSHPDFINKHHQNLDPPGFTNTTPTFRYLRRKLTRYVLVVENTKDMAIRESWSFLVVAIRKWTVHDLPYNTEVGFVLSNESSAVKVHGLHPLNGANARDGVASGVPFNPGNSGTPACISCGIREALEMLDERRRTNGPAASVILVISAGLDKLTDLDDVVERARRTHVRIATINYPGVLRNYPLDVLSSATGGMGFTVNEQKHSYTSSLLTTYFDLTNCLFAVTTNYFEGNPDSQPIEIHRRELLDDGRSSITGSFVLEESLGEPAEFLIYTHSIYNPLLGRVELISPSQKVYHGQTISLLQFNLMKVVTTMNETGTWTYIIERFRNPQPHFVQVMASPRSPTAPVVRARLWTNLDMESKDFLHERNRRELGSAAEEVENVENVENMENIEREWNPQISVTNGVNYHLGRSFESDPMNQVGTKTTRSFKEYDTQKMEVELENSKLVSPESRNGSPYKLTADDLRRTQGGHGRTRPSPVRTTKPVVLYAEVKRGDLPVRGARVEVTVTKRTGNDSNRYRERFELLDSGSGDPDLMKGDGIYSKYWSPVSGGKGSYKIEVTVTDNGNTAYSWSEGFFIPQRGDTCCGSEMRAPSVRQLSPFQRHLPPLTLTFTQEDIDSIQVASVGRVADLKVEHIPAELRARLIWTAPDMGGLNVANYSLHFSPSLETLLSDPSSTSVWSHGSPFPLSAGSETSFTLDFSQDRNMLDQPLYFAMLCYTTNFDSSIPGPLSNYVRVLIPSPPPPPPPSPTDYSITKWFHKNNELDTDDGSVVPRIAQADFRLELILPIVGGLVLLVVCLGIYCYFCIVRRKHSGINKAKQTPTSSPEKNKQTSINIISSPTALNIDNRTHSTSSTTSSSSTSHSTLQQDNATNLQYDVREPPVPYQTSEQLHKYGYVQEPNGYHDGYSEGEGRSRYSVMQSPEEAYMIAEARSMSQQRPPSNMSMPAYNQQPPGYIVSQISNGTTGRIRTLSPFQSWTASQLLHEHERRNSPMETSDRIDDINRHRGPQFQLPPPVPPLPAGAFANDSAYGQGLYSDGGVRSSVSGINTSPNYAGYVRSAINPSLQGSLSSVNSGDVRKKRSVTMV